MSIGVEQASFVVWDSAEAITRPEPVIFDDIAVVSGKWIEFEYEQSLTGPVERPIVEFVGDAGGRMLLPAAVFGRASWLGYVPPGIVRMRVTGRATLSGFRISKLKTLTTLQVWRHALSVDLWGGFKAIASSVFKRHKAERLARRAFYSRTASQYDSWCDGKTRLPDWTAFDRPSDTALSARVLIIYIDYDILDISRLSRKLIGPLQNVVIRGFSSGSFENLNLILNDVGGRDLVMFVRPGGKFRDGAAAVFVAAAMRSDADVFYSDEEFDSGNVVTPHFKPDWSPTLAENRDLLGNAWAARAAFLRKIWGERTIAEVAFRALRPNPSDRVEHIARPLLRTSNSKQAAPKQTIVPKRVRKLDERSVTIIIPTHNRPKSLCNLISAIENYIPKFNIEIIVIANRIEMDSYKTLLYLLDQKPNVKVIYDQNKFNFSALCNRGASIAKGEYLVFLNDDVAPSSKDWLGALLFRAAAPHAGAVGALLLYPNGLIQHRGIVIGIEDGASHFEVGASLKEPDFFDRANVAHEISAVTGACLAVERRKFEAVGGFDEVEFPVEYSDVDLCLRLSQGGWPSILEPAAILIHSESATRKSNRSVISDKSMRRAKFHSRWYEAMRSDPYFHPALSLDSPKAELG